MNKRPGSAKDESLLKQHSTAVAQTEAMFLRISESLTATGGTCIETLVFSLGALYQDIAYYFSHHKNCCQKI